jgi:zinc protease
MKSILTARVAALALAVASVNYGCGGGPPPKPRAATPPSTQPADVATPTVAQTPAPAKPADAAAPQPIQYTEETLPNGLRVIYAPLKNAPVVHVRMGYHVGSRDERPDRQGFAHMFEHMMFRGSKHVGNQEHMRLVNGVGGISNAFTSFDQTVYWQTVPAQHLEMCLYLEADRMASFKVDGDIYKTERQVVGEEWRLRQNRPYGTIYEDLLGTAFTKHSYRWTPIGNMQHLAAAGVQDLQDFFNTYYLPNNAVLTISGDFDLPQAKQWVQKYYGWIPKGPEISRLAQPEPKQTETRRVEVPQRVPLAMAAIAYHTPGYSSDDHFALDLASQILGSGRTSRLDRLLVNSDNPQAVQAGASNMQLQDSGMFMVNAVVMQGKDAEAVEKALLEEVAKLIEGGVTAEELEKAKTQARIGLIRGRQTAENVAAALQDEALFANDPARANTALAKLEAVTPADVQAAAKKYLSPESATIMRVKSDPLGAAARAAAATQASTTQASTTQPAAQGPAAPVTPRAIDFPADYPQRPPINDKVVRASFNKGVETTIDGVKVIVMPDSRLPLVSWSLTTRAGSHLDPVGKEGLAGITADMLRRGAGGLSFAELNQDLESRGINVEASAGGDTLRVGGSSLSKDLSHGMLRTRQVLLEPAFPAAELEKLKAQSLSSLSVARETPGSVADEDLDAAIYGTSALGRSATPESVQSITLDDVRNWYDTFVHRKDAIFVISGDVTVERGQELARELLANWKNAGEKDTVAREPLYTFPAAPTERKILLIDHPEAKGASIRMGVPSYAVKSDDKFAGTLAGQILTSGIDSRLNKYVRAEKGLSYGVHGTFQPNRYAGMFGVSTDGRVEKAAESVTAIFEVLEKMRGENVTDKELFDAKTRTIGLMLMGMQTIQQQASYRVDGILNGYPLDYYDVYPEKVAAVSADQIRELMNKYVVPNQFTVVVVAPAKAVQAELEKLGKVTVIPMPNQRGSGNPAKSPELLQPAVPATKPAAEAKPSAEPKPAEPKADDAKPSEPKVNASPATTQPAATTKAA